MIQITIEKTKQFKKPDGSYGYTLTSPPNTSQNAPVCPPGYIEGDVNGGSIALGSVWGHMCNALGINIELYSYSDGERFKFVINQLESVIKYDYE